MSEERFDVWAVVELLGHRVLAGRVTEHIVAGAAFVRVDVPETANEAAFTKLIGAGSIYAISPCSEEVARAAARQLRAEPIPIYVPRQLPPPSADADLDEDEGFDEEDADREGVVT